MTQNKLLTKRLSLEKRLSPPASKRSLWLNVNYSFISIFNPSSIKNLTLYYRNFNTNNSSSNLRGSFRNYKILVKQSYLMSAWFYYYSHGNVGSKKIKGFATLPCKQTKHTAAKAPMAHKTFSQEQFVIKYYFLTFKTETRESLSINCSSLNLSILIANTFKSSSSFCGTNLFILYRVKTWFSVHDTTFFKYCSN